MVQKLSGAFPNSIFLSKETCKNFLQIKTTALRELFTCGFVPCVSYNTVLLVGIGLVFFTGGG